MSNIEIKNLNFSYGSQVIFKDAKINIDDQWKLGLVGRNGRGKTTLLKILQGQVDSDIQIIGQKKFNYLPMAVEDSQQLTYFTLQELAESTQIASVIAFEQWELEKELNLLQVDLDVLWRPFESLSGGEQTKCLLALLFLDKTGSFPLLDEPTNHLDIESRQEVANYLQSKNGFILVSHDRHFLNQVTDHTLAIERGQLVLYQGNFATYESEKAKRDQTELEQNTHLQKEIGRLKQTARDKADWSKSREKGKDKSADSGFESARAARQMKKSKNLERRMSREISEKEGLLKNLEKIDDLSMNYQPSHHQLLLKAERLQLLYKEKVLFQPIDFELKEGEVLAITGPNGIGKSSLINLIEEKFSGQVQGNLTMAQNIRISKVDQLAKHSGSLKDFAREENLEYEIFLSNLRKLGLERNVFDCPIEKMSQGQQKKVELAKSLSQPAELYIWDEPVNYLDVFNQEQIIKLIQSVKPSLLIIEHDQEFIKSIAHKKCELFRV